MNEGISVPLLLLLLLPPPAFKSWRDQLTDCVTL